MFSFIPAARMEDRPSCLFLSSIVRSTPPLLQRNFFQLLLYVTVEVDAPSPSPGKKLHTPFFPGSISFKPPSNGILDLGFFSRNGAALFFFFAAPLPPLEGGPPLFPQIGDRRLLFSPIFPPIQFLVAKRKEWYFFLSPMQKKVIASLLSPVGVSFRTKQGLPPFFFPRTKGLKRQPGVLSHPQVGLLFSPQTSGCANEEVFRKSFLFLRVKISGEYLDITHFLPKIQNLPLRKNMSQ